MELDLETLRAGFKALFQAIPDKPRGLVLVIVPVPKWGEGWYRASGGTCGLRFESWKEMAEVVGAELVIDKGCRLWYKGDR